MSSSPKMEAALREAILAQPDAILDDKDLMNALIAANERAMGANVIDLRGIAMERMEHRLDRLEDTHRSVIAAAYENVSGTHQIHRAILAMLDAVDFETFLTALRGEVTDVLRIDAVRLVLETEQDRADPALSTLDDTLALAAPGFVEAYLNPGRQARARQVTLRAAAQGSDVLFGDRASALKSEACLMLDFGPDCLPGLLVLASEDGGMFGPHQGTDLLVFLTGVVERVVRRWLS